jgi:acetyl esterase/lipase
MSGGTDIPKNPGISISYRLLVFFVGLLGYKRIFSLDEAGLRSYVEKSTGKQKISPPGFIYRKNQVRKWMVDGRPCYIISPKKGGNPEKTLLFLHGGGMIMETQLIHWIVISRLTKALGATLWVPAYPLAPHGFKEITEMLFRVYGKMLEEHPGSEFSILGDSAGAALALMLCHHNKALGMPLAAPKKLILLSPGTVVRKDDRTIREAMDRIFPRDPLLSPRFMDTLLPWMGLDVDRGSYLDLPMEGDFLGFPPLFVFFGTNEIFYAGALPFVERVKAAGVPVKLYIGEGMMHIWPYMPVSRESREALKEIFEIINTRSGIGPDQYQQGA